MNPEDVWQDDGSWWHQQDLELQQREEQERIEACNRAIAALTENNHEGV